MSQISTYDEVTADLICHQLAMGRSLREICKAPDLPTKETIFTWLVYNADFYAKYARARLAQAEAMDDRILETAERCLAGEIDANQAKAAIGAFQWRASKLAPKVYGDSTLLKHGDANGDVLKVEVTRIADVRQLTPPKLLEAPKDPEEHE